MNKQEIKIGSLVRANRTIYPNLHHNLGVGIVYAIANKDRDNIWDRALGRRGNLWSVFWVRAKNDEHTWYDSDLELIP